MTQLLIVGGFHRSGTSALTQALTSAGCKLPSRLVGPNITNPDGHFEDFRVIRFHDQQLARHNASWQFVDSHKNLTADRGMLSELIQHLTINLESNDVLVLKDPRICLFLDDWEAETSGAAKYVFVVRHWLYSVESLLSRHSKRIAEAINTKDVGRHLNFWLQPKLAAEMWLSYNTALLEFKRQHPEKVKVFTQRGLSDTSHLLSALHELGICANVSEAESQDRAKLNGAVSQRLLTLIPRELRLKLNNIWNQSKLLSEHHSKDESVRFYVTQSVSQEFNVSVEDDSQLKWLTPKSSEAFIEPQETSKGLEAELNQIEEQIKSNLSSLSVMMRKVDLLNTLNRLSESKAVLNSLFHRGHTADGLITRMFDLLERTEGHEAAKRFYTKHVELNQSQVSAIEHRLMLRDRFAEAKDQYRQALTNGSSTDAKAKYLSQLLRMLPCEVAQQDLKERLYALWK